MPARKPLLPPDAAAFVHGAEPPAAAPAAALATTPPAAPAVEPEARVRFTVDLPRSLHKRLKLAALERDQPMTDLARQALAEWLEGQA
ncbi:MAG: hypothetical protein ACKOGI_07380 [Vulcanococcus sp.]